MIGLGVNIATLGALRQLGTATDSLARVSERLSSGQRINRASDDAAGLAIASGLNSKARIYTQSMRNLNDAISALAIADGAAGELSTVITRLQELAAQSANGSYSTTQRRALDNEAQKLRSEFNRLVATTKFNGINVLDESTGRIRLQAGNTSANAALYMDPSNLSVANKGTGSFTSKISSSSAITSYEVVSADFNNDGILDLVREDSNTGGILLQLGNGDGSFKGSTVIGASAKLGLVAQIQTADVNGDGITDIVAAGQSTYTYLGNGDGSFKSPIAHDQYNIGGLALADWNNDGKVDLITGDDSGIIRISLGNGDGTFDTIKGDAGTFSSSIYSLAVGDLNGDGKLDVVAGGVTNSAATVYFAGSNGTLSSGSNVNLNSFDGSYIGDILLYDLNGDSRLDIVVGKGDGQNSVYLNQGSNSFSTESLYGSGGYSSSLADLNGDGKVDLISSGNTGSPRVAYGNGDGTFGTPQSFASGVSYATGLAVADFNGDGVSDLSFTDLNDGNNYTSLTNTTTTSSLGAFSLTSRADALYAMNLFNAAQSGLGTARGRIGADQSRIASALSTVTASKENFLAAAGRIQDADIAAESAQLTRNRILQQTAAQVLAQASQQPDLVLKLLS
ncbi:MAG: VCBS repeat-containing protein [Deltaproteobacteria bacterium]|nr:VCBS repeat-containing protein [Deltaproteobacteria bacterium]